MIIQYDQWHGDVMTRKFPFVKWIPSEQVGEKQNNNKKISGIAGDLRRHKLMVFSPFQNDGWTQWDLLVAFTLWRSVLHGGVWTTDRIRQDTWTDQRQKGKARLTGVRLDLPRNMLCMGPTNERRRLSFALPIHKNSPAYLLCIIYSDRGTPRPE